MKFHQSVRRHPPEHYRSYHIHFHRTTINHPMSFMSNFSATYSISFFSCAIIVLVLVYTYYTVLAYTKVYGYC